MQPTAPASYLGKLVDSRYRLQRVVGQGASSWVFAATDQRLEREVALKVFKPACSEDDLKRRKRWIAEGRTLARLVHPHIVAIHDASEDSAGRAYLVMELCEAGTLDAELAQRGRLELSETLRLVLPLMGALAFAHDRNIVHRDIKPGNIVLVEQHGERRCKLLDFGISLSPGVGTSSELALGTPAYMAPEQVRGEPTTPATDVWALGVVVFRCLTGSLPFEASNAAGVLLKVAHGRAPRLARMFDPKLAPNVMSALDRALEPELERRYRDVRSFARALAVACTLDGLPAMRRPEPIGLPEFDAWVLAIEASPTTKPVPISGARTSALSSAERGRLARWVGRAVLAALITGLIGGALLSLSSASERSGAANARPPSGSGVPASAAADLHGSGTTERGHGPTLSPAVPLDVPVASAPVELEPAVERETAAPVKSPKRRTSEEAASRRPTVSGQASSPRVIMNWDW